jgi:hypothetical protein
MLDRAIKSKFKSIRSKGFGNMSEASLCSRTGHPEFVSGRRNSPKQQPAFAEAVAGHHAISAVVAIVATMAKSAHPCASARSILAKVSKGFCYQGNIEKP